MIYSQKHHHTNIHHNPPPHINHPHHHHSNKNTFHKANKQNQKLTLNSSVAAVTGSGCDTCEKPLTCDSCIGPITPDDSRSLPLQQTTAPLGDNTTITTHNQHHNDFDDYFSAKPTAPLLVLSPQSASLLDPLNIKSFYSLWSVFSKCSNTLENGKRLENMSWRLWNRELLFDDDSSCNSSANTSLASSISSITELCRPNISSDDSPMGEARSQRSHSLVESQKTLTQRFNINGTPNPTVNNTNNTTAPVKTDNTSTVFRDPSQQSVTLARRNTCSGVVQHAPSTQALNVASYTVNHTGTTNTTRQHVSLFPSNPRTLAPRSQACQPSHPTSNALHKQKLHNPSSAAASHVQTPPLRAKTSSLFAHPPARKPASLFPDSSTCQRRPPDTDKGLSLNLRDKRHQAVINSDSDDDDLSTDDDNGNFEDTRLRRSSTHQISTGFSQTNLPSTTSIVRGFGPSQVSISVRSSAHLHSANMAATTNSNESLTKARPNQITKEKMFFIESSSSPESEKNNSLTSSFSLTMAEPQVPAKINSLFGEPKVRTEKRSLNMLNEAYSEDNYDFDSDDFFDSDEDEFDDDSAWDSVDDESDNSASMSGDHAFERIESRPRLLNRPSLLSSMFLNKLHEEQSAVTGAKSPSATTTPDQYTHVSKSLTTAAAITTNKYDVDLHSPRTARRNMLACELSDSVRRNLLCERKQLSNISHGKIQRRHTSVDMVGLSKYQQQQQQQSQRLSEDDWNGLNFDFDYHARGW
jgi:hypothetical protein